MARRPPWYRTPGVRAPSVLPYSDGLHVPTGLLSSSNAGTRSYHLHGVVPFGSPHQYDIQVVVDHVDDKYLRRGLLYTEPAAGDLRGWNGWVLRGVATMSVLEVIRRVVCHRYRVAARTAGR